MTNDMIRIEPRAEPFRPETDPWDPIHSLQKYNRDVLTSVEMTVTNLCNMRCEHCAVGDLLVASEGDTLPIDLVLKRLDEVEHLKTISITGGEPSFSDRTIDRVILPILRYARERGVYSQMNSNLTLDYGKYEKIAPYLDVMHISYNYTDAKDFHEITFARSSHPVSPLAAGRLYERMIENARKLSEGGLFVSAESMINYRTHRHLPEIHRHIVEMGCKRHEVHPMYPSAFAAGLPKLSLQQFREAIHSLLDARNRDIWMLFGTLPFFRCSEDPEDHELLNRLIREPNLTVRNDPDGRNRLNVNLFTGDVFVTDFADVPALGSILRDKLDDVFDRWTQEHPLNRTINCHCPAARCCGPNLLVADMYYSGVDFKKRRAVI